MNCKHGNNSSYLSITLKLMSNSTKFLITLFLFLFSCFSINSLTCIPLSWLWARLSTFSFLMVAKATKCLFALKTEDVDDSLLWERLRVSRFKKKERSSGRWVRALPERSRFLRRGRARRCGIEETGRRLKERFKVSRRGQREVEGVRKWRPRMLFWDRFRSRREWSLSNLDSSSCSNYVCSP